MKAEKLYPLCDFQCPLHDKCCWYLDGINKAKTVHWGVEPYNYKKGKCSWYVSMGLDKLIEKVNHYLKPFNN